MVIFLNPEFVRRSSKETLLTKVNWFKLLKFPSFAEAKRVEIKFKSQTPFKSFAVNTDGIRKAQYVTEQVCNSSVPIQQVNYKEKI